MAKLKYDRPINLYLGKEQTTTIPADEVWKLSLGFGTNPGVRTIVCGGVQTQPQPQRDVYRYRLQAHRRVNGSMEVVLHG